MVSHDYFVSLEHVVTVHRVDFLSLEIWLSVKYVSLESGQRVDYVSLETGQKVDFVSLETEHEFISCP
jgi:hypothetical protein